MTHLLVALLLASNASGKTLVRQQQGTTVPISTKFPKLFDDDANTLCHSYWDGAQRQDTKGCAFVMQGTVPMTARSSRTPPGAGAFSDANYYNFANPSPFHFAGDFTVCFAFSATSYANNPVLGSTGNASTVGWFVQIVAAGSGTVQIGTNGNLKATANTISTTGVNVVCAARTGTTNCVKLNGGTAQCATSAPYTVGTLTATIGRYTAATGDALTAGYLYETIAKSAGSDDATMAALMATAKARLGASSAY